MANRKATMTDIRVIIREFVRGTSLREMERKLKISRTSLRAYRDRAEASGKSMVELLSLEDAELNAIFVKGDGHRNRDSERYTFMMNNVEEYAQQMKRKYMTYEVLYEDYKKATDNPYGYTQFKAIIQEYEKNHDYKYHNVYEPGREMQFDFAGDVLWIVDKSTGAATQAVVLVCVLPYSMLSYAQRRHKRPRVRYYAGKEEPSSLRRFPVQVQQIHLQLRSRIDSVDYRSIL